MTFICSAVLNALVVSITSNVPLQKVDLEGIKDTTEMHNATISPKDGDESEHEHPSVPQHVLFQPEVTETSTKPENSGMDLTLSDSEETILTTPHFPNYSLF